MADERTAARAEPPACCDECGRRAWCRLVSWREYKGGGVLRRFNRGAFLCEDCRTTIPNSERGWGRDE